MKKGIRHGLELAFILFVTWPCRTGSQLALMCGKGVVARLTFAPPLCRVQVMAARSTKPLTLPDDVELRTSKRARRHCAAEEEAGQVGQRAVKPVQGVRSLDPLHAEFPQDPKRARRHAAEAPLPAGGAVPSFRHRASPVDLRVGGLRLSSPPNLHVLEWVGGGNTPSKA